MASGIQHDLKILRIGQVIETTGLSRSTIYRGVKEGSFPKQRSLGARSVGWFKHEIDEFLVECLKGVKMNKVNSGEVIRVTKRTRPDLNWEFVPSFVSLPIELIKSDAFRELTKSDMLVLCCLYSKKRYPAKRKRRKKSEIYDYWTPLNAVLPLPYVAVEEFYHKPNGMRCVVMNESTFQRAIKKLQMVGFISINHMGGNGVGDVSMYRLEHNWRLWKKGDPPCFEKGGLSRDKGFCKLGSKVFNPTKNKPLN